MERGGKRENLLTTNRRSRSPSCFYYFLQVSVGMNVILFYFLRFRRCFFFARPSFMAVNASLLIERKGAGKALRDDVLTRPTSIL